MLEWNGVEQDGPVDKLWQSPRLLSAEHFSYRPGPDAGTLAGVVILSRNGRPTTIDYEVRLTGEWAVRTCKFTVVDVDGAALTEIVAEDGRWWVNGKERPDLAGCTDIDLGWTPSTNSLPIRRISLAVGQSITIRAAWVTFPDMEVRPADQRYTRTGEQAWTYQSGNFTAELVTDHLGFVDRYGDGLWRAVDCVRIPRVPYDGSWPPSRARRP